MFIRNGQVLNIHEPHTIDDTQYPAVWFADPERRASLGIAEVTDMPPPAITSTQKLVPDGFEQDAEDRWVAKWIIVEMTVEEIAERDAAAVAALAIDKAALNLEINAWRAAINFTSFPYAGKLVACDVLSRSDIDVVASYIGLFGTFTPDFPGAWRAIDNSYIMLPTVDAFKAMYTAMAARGTANFNQSQAWKASTAASTTQADLDVIRTQLGL